MAYYKAMMIKQLKLFCKQNLFVHAKISVAYTDNGIRYHKVVYVKEKN